MNAENVYGVDRNRARAVALTLLAASLWGTSFPVIKVGLGSANPSDFLFFRFVIATAVLVAVFFALHKDRRVFLNGKLVLLGFIFSLSFFFQYVGQTGTAAGQAAVLLNSTPVIVPLMSYFAINERLGRGRYAAAGIGMVGVVLMSGALGPGDQGSTLTGVLEMMVSAVATSIYIIGTKRLSSSIRPIDFYPPVFLYGTIFMFIYALIFGDGFRSFASGAGPVLAILYLSLACSILPFFFWYWGLQHLSATASSVVTLFEPVVAIVVSVVFINEFFGVTEMIGTALIFAAILVISR